MTRARWPPSALPSRAASQSLSRIEGFRGATRLRRGAPNVEGFRGATRLCRGAPNVVGGFGGPSRGPPFSLAGHFEAPQFLIVEGDALQQPDVLEQRAETAHDAGQRIPRDRHRQVRLLVDDLVQPG